MRIVYLFPYKETWAGFTARRLVQTAISCCRTSATHEPVSGVGRTPTKYKMLLRVTLSPITSLSCESE